MAFVDWDESFSSGNAAVDTQHRRLIDLLNNLHETAAEGKDHSAQLDALQELVDYLEIHHRFESAILDVDSGIVDMGKDILSDFTASQGTMTTEEVSGLKDWIVGHIMDIRA